MGLLPADEHIATLDLSSFRNVVRHIHRAGIGRNIQFDLADASGNDLERTLEESPVRAISAERTTNSAFANGSNASARNWTGHPVGFAEGPLDALATWPPQRSGTGASVSRIARHMIVYRHADPRFPFLWESADQPPARWHGPGEGPAGLQYSSG